MDDMRREDNGRRGPLRAIRWIAVSTQPQAEDDKLSLSTQDVDQRAVCERRGWQIVDTMIVPGHSRRYIDIHECARDMYAQGIDAFMRLMDHWKQRDFDVLVVRDNSRFARTQSLHAYVVESTIAAGAFIYSLADGEVDERNYRMWTAMGGYAASSEMDRLTKGRKRALSAAAAQGLPKVRLPDTHKAIRNDRGEVTHVEIPPRQSEIYSRLGELLLEGVGWAGLSNALVERFGIINDTTGKPFETGTLHKRVYSPLFWGHIALGYAKRGKNNKHPWMLDKTFQSDVPEGVEMYYDALPAVIPEPLASRVKAEILRRTTTARRRWPVTDSYKFSGLLICADCKNRMIASIDRRQDGTPAHIYYRCGAARYGKCTNTKFVPETKVIAYMDRILSRVAKSANWSSISASFGVDDSTLKAQLEFVERTISDAEQRIRRTILRQSEIEDANLASAFDDVLRDLQVQLDQARFAKANLTASIQSDTDRARMTRGIDTLKKIGAQELWSLGSFEINQLLHDLFGGRCISIAGNQPIGFALPLRRGTRRKHE